MPKSKASPTKAKPQKSISSAKTRRTREIKRELSAQARLSDSVSLGSLTPLPKACFLLLPSYHFSLKLQLLPLLPGLKLLKKRKDPTLSFLIQKPERAGPYRPLLDQSYGVETLVENLWLKASIITSNKKPLSCRLETNISREIANVITVQKKIMPVRTVCGPGKVSAAH